jgi:microcystin-dependent protein
MMSRVRSPRVSKGLVGKEPSLTVGLLQFHKEIIMADPFLAEIRIFPFNFAPKGWAWCDGQILPISQNTALFSLLGTNYGGDGKVTFALPNLEGSAPLHVGGNQPGPGLSFYDLGQSGGTEAVTLLGTEMPIHNHFITAQTIDQGDNRIPKPTLNLGNSQMYSNANPSAQMDPTAIGLFGGSLPHNNMMPYLTLYFNIALQGVYPPRT